MVTDTVSDEALMLRYQQGDYLAFEQIYRRHSGRVYGYLRKRLVDPSEAGDLLQSVFLKVHRGRERYQASMPFMPWLYAVTRNVLTDYLRSVQRTPRFTELPKNLTAAESESPVGSQEAMEKVDESDRHLVEMRFNQELSFEEIAVILRVNPVTARKRLSRALQRIRKVFREEKKNEL